MAATRAGVAVDRGLRSVSNKRVFAAGDMAQPDHFPGPMSTLAASIFSASRAAFQSSSSSAAAVTDMPSDNMTATALAASRTFTLVMGHLSLKKKVWRLKHKFAG